jgi:hypothetical protein
LEQEAPVQSDGELHWTQAPLAALHTLVVLVAEQSIVEAVGHVPLPLQLVAWDRRVPLQEGDAHGVCAE